MKAIVFLSKKFLTKAKGCKSPEELPVLAKKEGVTLSAELVTQLADMLSQGLPVDENKNGLILMTKEFMKEAKKCEDVGTLTALAAACGTELSGETAEKLFTDFRATSDKLSDEKLDGVAGGLSIPPPSHL